jgi:hypothetical protein
MSIGRTRADLSPPPIACDAAVYSLVAAFGALQTPNEQRVNGCSARGQRTLVRPWPSGEVAPKAVRGNSHTASFRDGDRRTGLQKFMFNVRAMNGYIACRIGRPTLFGKTETDTQNSSWWNG